MLGGDDIEGQFIFVKASDYQQDQQNLANQRQQDLQQIEDSYIKKNSNASLKSLETDTIKNGQNTLQLSDVLKLNNKKFIGKFIHAIIETSLSILLVFNPFEKVEEHIIILGIEMIIIALKVAFYNEKENEQIGD